MPQTEVQELLDFFGNNDASSSAEDECTDPDSAPTEDVPVPTYELDFREAFLTEANSLFPNMVDMDSNEEHKEKWKKYVNEKKKLIEKGYNINISTKRSTKIVIGDTVKWVCDFTYLLFKIKYLH